MSTNRLEAFSDGVLAVAVTLLVLNLKVPDVNARLGHALLREWPSYAAYAVSFITIGIIWINHHAMIGRLRQADHGVLILNLLLLMSISVLPFATALMAFYLKRPQGQHLAAAVYSGAFLAMGIIFALLNRHVLNSRRDLLREQLPIERRRRLLGRSIAGLGPYLVATGLAPLSAYATLAICGLIALYYALPAAVGGAAE